MEKIVDAVKDAIKKDIVDFLDQYDPVVSGRFSAHGLLRDLERLVIHRFECDNEYLHGVDQWQIKK